MVTSPLERCRHCGGWSFRGEHRCPPVFWVWCPERDQAEVDAVVVRAPDAERAAALWAEHVDQSTVDFRIARGDEPTVHVRHQNGDVTRWIVRAEIVADYVAAPAKADP